MKIWKCLQPELIFLNVSLSDKDASLRFISDAFLQSGIVENTDNLYNGIKKREELMSTGIGGGIGIPHTACSDAKNAAILLIRLEHPIDFDSLDALPVDIIIAIVVPENKTALHLQMLAGISRLCRHENFLNTLRRAKDSQSLLDEIREIEDNIAFH